MKLTVTSALISSPDQFESIFCEKIASIKPNFFLSKSWISTWFQLLDCAPILITVSDKNENLVGAAIFLEKTINKLLFIPHRKFFLNATGRIDLDQIWIEYNDCYFLPEYENAVKNAIVNFLYTQLAADEIIIGTSTDTQLAGWEYESSLQHELFESKGYMVNFRKIRQEDGQFKGCLSKNSRSQINRSVKGYESKFGPLRLHLAKTPDEALNFFTAAAEWHQQRWSNTKEGSGFDNPHFINFHTKLIKKAFLDEEIKLIKVTAAEHILGFLYCFSFQNKIYFYLSSINYASIDNKLKPGLVMHYLTIQHFEALGFDSYDFLGGEARYKQSLSTDSYSLAMVSINKPSLAYRFKALARRIKNICTNQLLKVAIDNLTKSVKD